MGNTAGKEVRPRSNTYSSTTGSTINSYEFSSRRNTIFGNSNDYKKLKKQEERDKQREEHYLKLIVKFKQSVDGGYLAPFGIYKSNLDFNIEIIRDLIISRKLAPFYTPLQDFSESWNDEELIKILNQLTLHSIEIAYENDEEEDDIDNHKIHKSSNYYKRQEQKIKLNKLIEKVKSLQKDEENLFFETKQEIINNEKDNSKSEIEKNENILSISSNDLLLKLYKEPIECPICFLYFPNNLNLSRCCLQPICTECFVQIKRLDPHPPHDQHENSLNLNQPVEQQQQQSSSAQEQNKSGIPETLISEPANCPYCAMTDFGIIFDKNINIKTGINGIKPNLFRDRDNNISNINELSEIESPLSNELSGKFENLKLNEESKEKINNELNELNEPIDFTETNISGKRVTINEIEKLKQQQFSGGEVISSESISISSSPIKANSHNNNNNSFEKRKRRSSIPANSPKVITIDQIRPDWELKLISAKNKLARKAAAASAIHASNLIINPNNDLAEYDTRRRRSLNQNPNYQIQNGSSSSNGGNRENSRFQTIEDRMIEEALRLSLLDEQERIRKQSTPQSESSN